MFGTFSKDLFVDLKWWLVFVYRPHTLFPGRNYNFTQKHWAEQIQLVHQKLCGPRNLVSFMRGRKQATFSSQGSLMAYCIILIPETGTVPSLGILGVQTNRCFRAKQESLGFPYDKYAVYTMFLACHVYFYKVDIYGGYIQIDSE